MNDNFEMNEMEQIYVWATSLITKELQGDGRREGEMNFSCYVQPLGMKNCKKDPNDNITHSNW